MHFWYRMQLQTCAGPHDKRQRKDNIFVMLFGNQLRSSHDGLSQKIIFLPPAAPKKDRAWGTSSCKQSSPVRVWERSWRFISFAFPSIWAATAGTMLSTSGASSFKLADAHRMLESPCGTKPFAFRGIWAAIAGTMLSTTGASSFKLAAAHKTLESSCGFMSFAFRGIWAAIAGTMLSTTGASSFKLAAAHKTLESSCGFMSFAFRGIWAAIAGTMLSTSGASSFKLADAHKMLERPCAFTSFAFRGIWAVIAATMLRTSGASSFKLADAHKTLESSCGFRSFAFRGIWAAIAGTTSSALISTSDRCATLQRTLAHPWASNLSSATIPFTLRLSRSSKSFVLSPASSFPFLFHIASLWYEAEARKWSKIGPSKVRSKTFTNSFADFASCILIINLFEYTCFPRFPSMPPPSPSIRTLPWNLLRPLDKSSSLTQKKPFTKVRFTLFPLNLNPLYNNSGFDRQRDEISKWPWPILRKVFRTRPLRKNMKIRRLWKEKLLISEKKQRIKKGWRLDCRTTSTYLNWTLLSLAVLICFVHVHVFTCVAFLWRLASLNHIILKLTCRAEPLQW